MLFYFALQLHLRCFCYKVFATSIASLKPVLVPLRLIYFFATGSHDIGCSRVASNDVPPSRGTTIPRRTKDNDELFLHC